MKTLIKGVEIATVASAVPKNTLEMHSLGQEFGDKYVQRIQSSTGIRAVRIAEPGLKASDLCAAAAEEIFRSRTVSRSEIDGVVFVSQTSDGVMPATSVLLQDRLGLSQNCVAFDINYGCSGYLYGLFQAALLISSGACKKVLVLAGDVISPYLNQKDSHVRMVLGDAGTATLVQAGTGQIAIALHSDGSGAEHLCIREGVLHMDGTAIMNFALSVVPPVIEDALALQGWNKAEIDLFGLHQANQFMLSYLTKKLGVPAERVPVSVEDVGNTGPASIPLMLSREGVQLVQRPLDKVVLSGFGVGLSWGAASLSLARTKFLPMIQINKEEVYETAKRQEA